MTGEVVNLRRARKARQKAAEDRTAAENRVAFGRSRSEKSVLDAARKLAEARLSGHRRGEPDEP